MLLGRPDLLKSKSVFYNLNLLVRKTNCAYENGDLWFLCLSLSCSVSVSLSHTYHYHHHWILSKYFIRSPYITKETINDETCLKGISSNAHWSRGWVLVKHHSGFWILIGQSLTSNIWPCVPPASWLQRYHTRQTLSPSAALYLPSEAATLPLPVCIV